jgi:hypothetical protein
MPSREATTRYQEIIRGLLVHAPAQSARIMDLDPSNEPNATFDMRHRSAKGESVPGGSRVTDAGSITSDTETNGRPQACSGIVAEAGEPDRGELRPARGIVFAILLGVALWGLAIGVILIEAIR